MKDKIIHVLCEGQTEQGFVEEVLRPYLQAQGVKSVKGILITTNKKKNARGGMLNYNHAVTDIGLLRQTKKDDEYARHIFTTSKFSRARLQCGTEETRIITMLM